MIFRGWCEREGATRIGLGECRGRITPAREVELIDASVRGPANVRTPRPSCCGAVKCSPCQPSCLHHHWSGAELAPLSCPAAPACPRPHSSSPLVRRVHRATSSGSSLSTVSASVWWIEEVLRSVHVERHRRHLSRPARSGRCRRRRRTAPTASAWMPASSVATPCTVARARSLPLKPNPCGRNTPASDSIISTWSASSARCDRDSRGPRAARSPRW